VDEPEAPRRSLAPVAAGLVIATVVIAPIAAWLYSRATQDRVDRQTDNRLR